MAVESPGPQRRRAARHDPPAWLREHLPAGWMEAVDAGDARRSRALRGRLDYADWCIRFGEAGYATPTWPAEYGAGLSLSPGDARFVNEVLNHYKVPRPFNIIGIGMGGPTVMAWGTEEMKHRLLRPLASNQEIWCQLFSEPGAGSDVAGLATRAVRDGDEWVVNGQKVWTTVAHLSKWGMLLCRTNPDVPKHGGLSYFVVDMEQPGVEVRPLVQITGDAEFNEVFFNDARVRHDWMLGRGGRRVEGRDHHADERAGVAVRRGLDRRRRGRRAARSHRLLDRHQGTTDPLVAPAARAGVHREPLDPAQQPARRRQAQERRRGRARRARSPSCSRPSSTSGCRSSRSTSRARAASRGRATTCSKTVARPVGRPGRRRRDRRVRVPAGAGEHDRGRDLRHHAQHPRRAGARPAEGAGQLPRAAVEEVPRSG